MTLKEENSDFVYLGKRIDNALEYIQNNKIDLIEWFKQYVEIPYQDVISGELDLEEEDYIFDYLDSLLDDLEKNFNAIFETKNKMTQETLRMQFLSGVITESEYKTKLEELNSTEKKDSLNEHYVAGGIVGVGAINNPFEGRKKEKYEDAFEYFLNSKYELNEVEEGKEVEEPSLYEGDGNKIENYLTGLFDSIDLGDEYEEGPQSYTFERIEWAEEDLYGDEAAMFDPAHEYIESKGTINITDPTSGIPLVFTTNGEDIVVNFNTENFPPLN